QDGEEGESSHGEGYVPVPGGVAADLVVIETRLVFRGLETLLDHPPGSRDPGQFFERGSGRAEADVVGDVRVVGGPAPGQQPVVPALASPGPDRGCGPVVLARSVSAVAAAQACPGVVGKLADQLVGAGLPEE